MNNTRQALSVPRRRSNKQNGPNAEWVQEQKNRKILTYIGLYGLIEKTIIRIVKKDQENE